MSLASKKISKRIFVFFLLIGGLFFTRFLLAADFGTEIVDNGLANILPGGNGSNGTDPREIAGRIINFALGFLSLIAFGFVLWSGFLWMTSSGDSDKIDSAKKILKNALIGLLIILASWAITAFVLNKLFGVIGGTGDTSCIEGELRQCGCGGSMLCSGGSWGGCVGEIPENCVNPPASCDGNIAPGCQALNAICGAGYFCNNTCSCQREGGLGDSCDADLSNLTCDADNNRCAEYLSCNPTTCLCSGSPVITDFSPVGGFCTGDINKACLIDDDCGGLGICNKIAPNGAPGNFITIFGKNFGEYSATSSRVVFLGNNSPSDALLPTTVNPSCINSWQDDQIIVAIPSLNVQTGPVQVIRADGLEDSTNNDRGPILADFIINSLTRPGLCSLSPNNGNLGSGVYYQGINLFTGRAYFGNYQNNVQGLNSIFNNPTGLSGTSTIPNIKAGDSGSFITKEINGFLQKSNYLKFTKDPEAGDGPYIVSFNPIEGSVGQYITIKGSGFGGSKGSSEVYFVLGANKVKASYLFPAICANSVWKNNQIIIKVPEGLANERYQIQIVMGTSTISTESLNPNTFKFDDTLFLKPSLCKIDPEQGAIDTPVTFWGEYFGQINNNALIRFNPNKDTNGLIKKEAGADVATTTVPEEAVTGPVKIIKNNEAGNELNFAIGECTKNEECSNNQVCCPENTYKNGRCVGNISECFIDVPTSVFEWSFSTNSTTTNQLTFDSCFGLSKYLGSCYQGAMCPNSPGACSAPATSYQKIVGTCDISCETTLGCNTGKCTYDATIDKCVQNINVGICSLPETVTFTVGKKTWTTQKICNSSKQWEIISSTSCPSGWTRQTGNRCIQDNATCNLCDKNFTCEDIGGAGRCASDKLCGDKDAKCIDNIALNLPDNCTIEMDPACECCCRIGKEAEDCCSGLSCTGKCGSDIIANTGTYGSCSGCGLIGNTTAEHDAACNCSGHNSQFCDISAENPGGICVDCANISSQTNCGDHSSVCCFDSNKTADISDDLCRGIDGGEVVSLDEKNKDYGYCAYYNCQDFPLNPLVCASTTLERVGFFSKLETCINDCPAGGNNGNDPCAAFNGNQNSCINEANCCYDAGTLDCTSGDRIVGGLNDGFCAYYACEAPPFGNPLLCDSTPTTTAIYKNFSECSSACANPLGGPGLDCSGVTAETCNFGLCNFPGFDCLQENGAPGNQLESCGTCCCEVGKTPDSCVSSTTPSLFCQADKGSCTGSGRGLCCGCSNDSDCGNIETIGCGMDTCCEARPSIASTSPSAAAANICRNAAIKIYFNERMDFSSFGNNFLLFEEREYGNGVCPAGTFLTDNRTIEELIRPKTKNIFVRVWNKINLSARRLFGQINDRAIAAPIPPTNDKLYCAIPGTVSAEEEGNKTNLVFFPSKLLSPATNYYVVVKGDENLDSQSGILSFSKIGLNERGFNNGVNFTHSSLIKFNEKTYLNSYSFSFQTLSDQGLNAGICAVDRVNINPVSYLFKTTVNDLNEADDDIDKETFNTVADRDKVFTAGAYSSNNQLLNSVSGYAWNWSWEVGDTNVVDIVNPGPTGILESSKLVAVKPNVTDGETKVTATLNMNAFNPDNGCINDCNVFFAGDGEAKSSDVYVFICNNPWPAIQASGAWFPWQDEAVCEVNNLNCDNFNYKFYYCRDAGNAGTLDDLPAITSSPIDRGQSNDLNNLLCSSDRTPCSQVNSSCGKDQNGDGNLDGICYWNILKESYFFRERILSGGEITEAVDTGRGGEINLKWNSLSQGVGSYKIYYLKSGQSTMSSKEFSANPVNNNCRPNGLYYECEARINNLINNEPYVFKLTVVSINKTESSLSGEKIATPTDQTKPVTPSLNSPEISTTTVKFSFTSVAAPETVAFYRLYHGVVSGKYGESFDSAPGSGSIVLNRDQLSPALNYFVVTAVGFNNHESNKSNERGIDLQ